MFGDHLLIQIINFNKIWILQSEISKELSTPHLSLLKLLKRDAPTFHYTYEASCLCRYHKYGIVYLIIECGLNVLFWALIDNQSLFTHSIVYKANSSNCPCNNEFAFYNEYVRYFV